MYLQIKLGGNGEHYKHYNAVDTDTSWTADQLLYTHGPSTWVQISRKCDHVKEGAPSKQTGDRLLDTTVSLNAWRTIKLWFSRGSVLFGLVLFINCLVSGLLMCPFHKELIICERVSFEFCQTDDPRFSFIMYCSALPVYTWRELTSRNLEVCEIQFLT